MTLLSVRHITRYTYKAPVRFGDHRCRSGPTTGGQPPQKFLKD
jgi:hypothetical protein